ncbi:MAG TPA: TetR/AcrR family transcriptional regulator [Aquaticitalea sp.]|nr:TetR/AcrR family transcriptional regulator [Aquaticitalea sp.]
MNKPNPENRKDEIIKTAAGLFKKKGYSAVTMRDIAQTMGIKAASLYNHIQSKQDILNSIVISIAQEFTKGMETIKATNSGNLEKLHQIVLLHVDITAKNTYQMASLNNDWMHLESQLDYYLQLRNAYEKDVMDIIKAGIESNEFIDANPEIIMFSILSTLRSLYLWIPKKEELDTNELAHNLSKVLIQGISRKN